MPITGAITNAQTIPNSQILQPGDPIPQVFFALRETPRTSVVILQGGENRNYLFRAVVAYSSPQNDLLSRLYIVREPFSTTKTLQLQLAGTSAVTATLTVSRSLAANVLGFANVSANLVTDHDAALDLVDTTPDSLRSLRRRRRVWKEWQI